MLNYMIKQNDTLASIAASHRSTQAAILAANPTLSRGLVVRRIIKIPVEPLAAANAVVSEALDRVSAVLRLLRNADTADHPAVDEHFKLSKSPATRAANLQFIIASFAAMERAFKNPAANFREVTNDLAAVEGLALSGNNLAGAYVLPGHPIAFVSHYPSLGTKAQTAVIIHEGAHFVSRQIGHGEGESGPRYRAESPSSAIRNAHCYANFAFAAGPATLAWDGQSDFASAWRSTMFDPDRPWGLARPTE